MTSEDRLVKPEGFKDQAPIPDDQGGIYGRDALVLVTDPLPVIGVSGEALENDDATVEDKELE